MVLKDRKIIILMKIISTNVYKIEFKGGLVKVSFKGFNKHYKAQEKRSK